MKVPIYQWSALTEAQRQRLFERSEANIASAESEVRLVVDDVKTRGDNALVDLIRKYDHTEVSISQLRVSERDWDNAVASLSPEVKSALDFAIENARAVHMVQKPHGMNWVQVRPGLMAGERPLPIDSAGLYVPRGRGRFPSMVYMQAIPAQIAQVPRVVMVTPSGSDGVDPACLYAARACGVHEVYCVGGPGAIAALAYGTASIAPVVKIFGPGSALVSAAKRLVSTVVDLGLPAGPSESMILADHLAKPWKVALDLLVEAEHGADSAALLVTTDLPMAQQTAQFVTALASTLPEPRKNFVEGVFAGYGGIIVCDSLAEGASIVNRFAPEHLSIQTEEPMSLLHLITNASEILLGEDLPFSGANYACGANAILPTGGRAKSWGPLSVRDFIRYSSVVWATSQGYDALRDPVTTLAEYEGFPAHAAAFIKRGDA